MRISPVNFNQNVNQNFKGIMHLAYEQNEDDNAQETSINVSHYDYYPFSDETKEEIREATEPLDNTKYEKNPYPTYNTLIGSITEIKPALNITKERYAALKSRNMSDEEIIKIFA